MKAWIQAFAYDPSNQLNGDSEQRQQQHGLFGLLSDEEEDETEDITGLQMECTVHEVLLKSQVGVLLLMLSNLLVEHRPVYTQKLPHQSLSALTFTLDSV